MCTTSEGYELTRVTLVDADKNVRPLQNLNLRSALAAQLTSGLSHTKVCSSEVAA